MTIFLFIIGIIYQTGAFNISCPEPSERYLRSKAVCTDYRHYTCLYDEIRSSFSESCSVEFDFQRPGYRVTLRTNLHAEACPETLYQPFIFFNNKSSHCELKRSFCSNEGQIVSSNGTIKSDRQCRCNYANGYTYVNKPRNPCSCIPSEEDCSCYRKLCSKNHILSPDYQCIDQFKWPGKFNCSSISELRAPTVTVSGNELQTKDVQRVNCKIEKYRKGACVAILSLILSIIMIKVGFCCLTSEFFSLISKNCFTGLVQIPLRDSCKLDDEIATYMANQNTSIERKIVAIEAVKEELKDKTRKLENDFVKVPSDVKEFQNQILQDWARKLKNIVKTRATEFVYEKSRTQKVIVIAGTTGAGKSASAYYAAFRLKEESGYTIIPARQSMDITNYHVPGSKQIFIIDDFIGKYTVDETYASLWEKNGPLLNMIVSNNDDTKLILTSRTYIWQPERYKCLGFSAYTCDLVSDQLSLSLTERWGICHSYLNQVDIKALDDETILMYSFFPFLCSSYSSSENIPVKSFFTVPYQIIEDEINNFKIKSQISYIALAILAINQKISKTSVSLNNHDYDKLLQDVFHESAFLQYPSKNLLTSSLVGLTGTYVKTDSDNFMFTHETLQKIVLHCIAKTLIKSVIKYCKTEVILNQLRLNCFYVNQNDFTIEVTAENEDAYFQRLVYELGEGCNKAIFENEQNKVPQFRLMFIKYMNKYLSRDYWTKTQSDMPPLHVVSALGYNDYTTFFLQENTMINQKDRDGNIPLHLACMKGHTTIVKSLVENKSTIDIANNERLKPFVYACENNNIQVAKYLLHHSAKSINVNEKYQTKNNGTVLHIVSAKCFTNLVLLLLEKKADVDARDGRGCTPLHYASNCAVAKALLDMNAKINAIDSLGRSPVYLACGTKNERVLQLLIEKNAEINQKTLTGLRPIHAACQSGSIGIVKMLLENGATVNSSKPGIVPLHEACKIGNESITNILIAANASVNHKTKDGFTPLHEACMNGHVVVAQILLDNKANVNDANKYGCTALFLSCARGFHTVIDLLLQHGANVNICDEDKVSSLMVACKEDKTGVVDLLLRSKANVNHCDKDNCSSLAFACKTGNVDLVELLLTYGADINLADKDMIFPLHIACMYHHTNVVLILIEHKANVNAQDNLRQTPLFKSSINGYIDILDILLKHGASVDICDNFGKSPLAIAEIKGHKTIVHELKQYRHSIKSFESNLQYTEVSNLA